MGLKIMVSIDKSFKFILLLMAFFVSGSTFTADNAPTITTQPVLAAEPAKPAEPEKKLTILNGVGDNWRVILNYVTPSGVQTNTTVHPDQSATIEYKHDGMVKYSFAKNEIITRGETSTSEGTLHIDKGMLEKQLADMNPTKPAPEEKKS
jgi:hypothetical protein